MGPLERKQGTQWALGTETRTVTKTIRAMGFRIIVVRAKTQQITQRRQLLQGAAHSHNHNRTTQGTVQLAMATGLYHPFPTGSRPSNLKSSSTLFRSLAQIQRTPRTTSSLLSPCSIGKSKLLVPHEGSSSLIDRSSSYLILRAYCRKGYISSEDLKVVFQLLDETVSDEELHSKCHTRRKEAQFSNPTSSTFTNRDFMFSNDQDSWD